MDHGNARDALGKPYGHLIGFCTHAQMTRLSDLGKHCPALDAPGLGAAAGWIAADGIGRVVRVLCVAMRCCCERRSAVPTARASRLRWACCSCCKSGATQFSRSCRSVFIEKDGCAGKEIA